MHSARRFFVSGDVQGVGFRYFVLREAQKIGNLKGFVRNLPDGRVEAFAEGEDSQLRQLQESIHRGPRGSYVSHLEVHEETPVGKYSDFRITF